MAGIGVLLAAIAGLAVSGFEAAESCFWDAASKSWYVSNVVGSPTEKDGKGWISKLDADGKVVAARWVSGLNAPKGIRVHRGKLYVSDIDEVAVIDVKRRKILRKIRIEGAKFLNDVAVDSSGTVYISDTFNDAIYRLAGGTKPELFLQTEQLEGPNGLLVDDDTLVVAAWGHITDPATFGVNTSGRLLLVDLKTKEIRPFGSGNPIGNLDGLEKDGNAYLVTDWVAGKLFRISEDGGSTVVKLLKEGFKNSADIGWDPGRRLLAVPEMGGGTVQFLSLADR